MGESQKHAKSRNVFERFQTFWAFFSTKFVSEKLSPYGIMLVAVSTIDIGIWDRSHCVFIE